MNRTNGETSKWINSQKNLSLRAGFEEANTFFGTFPGDHKTFGTWKESFLRKEKKIKNEAQQRVMKEVGEVENNTTRHLWSTCHHCKVLDLSAKPLNVKNAKVISKLH